MSARGWSARVRRAVWVVSLACVGAALVAPWTGAASAQVAMHREVPRGEVTGLEMGIEGSLEATPGAPVRWWITLFEVLHHRELRAASGCQVRAMASHERAEPIATVSTDASGRAALVMPMDESLDATPHLVLDATCPRGVRRLFDVDLELGGRQHVALAFDRASVPPEGSALLIGRLLDRATGRGVPGHTVQLEVRQDGRALGAAERLTTDETGLFSTRVQARTGGAITVTAVSLHEDRVLASATAQLPIATPRAAEPLSLRVTVTPQVAAPGALVDVQIEARGADGMPVEGALVTGPDRDPPPDEGPPLEPIRTDARGVAHHPWRLPREGEAGPLVDVMTPVSVSSTMVGSAQSTATVRVARRAAFVTLAVNGGVLVPDAPTRILARVLGPDGAPLGGRDVELSSEILGSVDGASIGRARTDADGFVAFDVARVLAARMDDCGGTTAASVEIHVGAEVTPVCVPVDPDAPLALRAPPRLAPGSSITLTLARTSRATNRPVIVTALRRSARGWVPIAQEIAGPTASTVSLTLGDEAAGDLWLRARVIMPDGQVVRGASTLVSFTPPPGSVSVEADRSGVRAQGTDPTDSVLVLAEAAEPGASGEVDLVATLAGDAELQSTTAALTGLALEAELAIRVPSDLGASGILRGSEIVPQAMPEEPITQGLLRDPWRTRARFVRGRLGRLFLAVEELVERRIPDRIGEVASSGPRGWTWNREMLAAAVSEGSIDDEGSASLDGEPLDIDALVTLDPSFTFDHVARRITRRRLFRVVRAIRNVTHERNLDLPWARRGDPRTWIASLVGVGLEDGTTLSTDDLFDAWGRAFVFRPTTHRSFLPAIEGWEVASLGPDGRDGNADDLFDPFARVLPSGSLYADAVGEDALVARVSGVALGRAWVARLEEDTGEGGAYWFDETTRVGGLAETWDSAPMPLREPPPLGGGRPIVTQPGALLGATRAHRWSLPSERRSYVAIAIAVPREGRPRIAWRPFEAGARVVVHAELPELLRVDDRVSVPIVATEPGSERAPTLAVSVEGDGVAASLEDTRGSEATATASLVLEARAGGSADIVITAGGSDDSAEPLVVRRHVRVIPGGSLVVTHASALLAPGQELVLPSSDAPRGRRLSTTAVAAAPRGLDELPFFSDLTRADAGASDARAAVLAWARTLAGRLDADLAARAERATGTDALADACALVALSSTTDHQVQVNALRTRFSSATPSDLRERAAMMVALSGVASVGATPSTDPVAALWTTLRSDGWRALATERSSPSVMARVAAGLLLADAEDGPGRALYRSALEALVDDGYGGRALRGDPARVGDGWIGTLALALAARQVGDDLVADELALAASRELHLLRRTGDEGPFWVLAASVFGAFGGGAEVPSEAALEHAALEHAGRTHTLTLDAEAVPLALEAGAPAVRVRGTSPVVVALEARELRELEERTESELDVRIEGVLGDEDRLGEAGARSALELVVTSGPTDVASPVIEVELPSLASLDEVARGALSRSSAVASVSSPDRGGVVRIVLAPLRAATTVHVPLVVSWLGAGEARGLSIVAYDAASPARLTTRPGRRIELAPRRGSEEATR
ncbi:MAG: hypothetical protein U0353_10280 [Sandaracinus sp.]